MTGPESKWLVVGFGSDLGGDDGFGPAVAKAVSQAVAAKQVWATVLAPRILGPELVENIAEAGAVIFIDASAALEPGRLAYIDLQDELQAGQEHQDHGAEREGGEIKYNSSAIATSHHCDPRTLMQLTETLYGARPPAWLFIAGGSAFGLSETMSASMAAVVPQAAAKIIELLSRTQA